MGALITRALLFGVYIGAPDFFEIFTWEFANIRVGGMEQIRLAQVNGDALRSLQRLKPFFGGR